MSTLSADSAGSEVVFVELVQALAHTNDRLAVLADFIHRFPEHEVEIRELANFHSALDDSPVALPPPPIPDQLGEFRIGRLIKVGGMGEIYEAYQERLDRRVALKIVRRGWTNSLARERFAREQHLLAKLHHSNIVPIQTGGEDGPIQYFTMPFIQGSALNHVVDAVASLSASTSSGRTPSVQEIVSRVLQNNDKPTTDSVAEANSRSGPAQPGKTQVRLSRSYFTSVARTMIDVANAIEYAHRAGVLHRDLKPANVMIESSGHCWVIDFGLAARLKTHERHAGVARTAETLFGNTTCELGGGTYNYMAPERWQHKPADERSDVFSLGAMLYELIALRQAYSGATPAQIKYNILRGIRVPAKKLVKHLPTDLAAIADKAMSIDPSLRYQSAAEFAEDLNRWLHYEPIAARPVMPWKRLLLWTRRRPGLASACMFCLTAAVCVLWAIVDSYKNQTEVAEAANRSATMQMQRDRLQQALLGEHSVGWSESAWSSVRKLVNQDATVELRSLAAETQVGLDAQRVNHWPLETSHLAYNSAGTKLLMVEHVPTPVPGAGHPQARRVQLWDSITHKLQQLPAVTHEGAGPVTFRNDDQPLQLVWSRQDPSAIVLWDLTKQAAFARLQCSDPLTSVPQAWSMVPGGAIVAALVPLEGRPQVMVWETATGNTLAQLQTNASVMELSPDGQLLAAGCGNGSIEVWSVKEGIKIASLSENHAEVLCFAWTKDRTRTTNPEANHWLLATGAFGGDLTIWDVAKKSVRARCIGSCFEIFSLAFSPDGMTLASAGRTQPMLWNVATGELLLRLGEDNTMSAIAYAASGDKLAIGSQAAWGNTGGATEYEIQERRGQQVLRGLRSRVSQVRISANNRFVAALTDNWHLAIWDLKQHRLLHVFQVPIGVYAETSGLAIDDAEQRIAIVAGSEAKIWDIHSAAVLKTIALPPGFMECLRFVGTDGLLSIRQESIDPKFPPVGSNLRPDQTPRQCVVRNLLGPDAERPSLTIADFPRSAVSIHVTPSGEQVLIEGYYEGGTTPEHRLIRLYDLPAGTRRWEMRTKAQGAQNHRIRAVDPLGRVIAMAEPSMHGHYQSLVDLQSGIEKRIVPYGLTGLGPDASITVLRIRDELVPGRHYLAVVQEQDQRELLRLGLTKPTSEGVNVAVSSDERYIVYGCSDGSVVVTDLWSVQRKLTGIGLN